MEMEADRLPKTVVGRKVTLIVQLLPAATLEQLFVCENWPASTPVRLTPLTVNVALPALLTVIVCAELVVFVV